MGDSAQISMFLEVKEFGIHNHIPGSFLGIRGYLGNHGEVSAIETFTGTSSALLCVLLVSNTYHNSKMEEFLTESFCFEYTFLVVFLRLTAYSIFVVVEASQRLWVFGFLKFFLHDCIP